MKPSRRQSGRGKVALRPFKPGERLAFGQVVKFPFTGGVMFRNRRSSTILRRRSRAHMKVTMQDDLVSPRRCPQPLAKDGILPDRRHSVVIGNHQKRHSVYSRPQQGRRSMSRHNVPSKRAYIVNGDDKGPARRLHLQKACVNGMVLINV